MFEREEKLRMKLDQGSEEKLKLIYPDIAERWRMAVDQMYEDYQIRMRITEGFRDFKTQFDYWSRGRSQLQDGSWVISSPKDVVTHAKPGQSMHHYGLAIDVCVVGEHPYPNDQRLWQRYGKCLAEQGLGWGGLWAGAKNDRPHCEDKYNFTTLGIQKLFLRNKQVSDVWDAIAEKRQTILG